MPVLEAFGYVKVIHSLVELDELLGKFLIVMIVLANCFKASSHEFAVPLYLELS